MFRFARSLIMLSLAAVSAACSDGATGASDEAAPSGALISNPLLIVSVGDGGSAITVSSASSGVVYLSLEPGTLPTAEKIQIYNSTRRGPASLVLVTDGGFDPVAVRAKANDVIRMDVILAGGIVRPMSIKVPARRNPRVVRTNPSRGRTDVALSVTVTIVFTEPVNPTSVTPSSVSLVQNGRPIAGRLILASDGLSADFTPASPLAPHSDYQITVSRDVKDFDGDPLDSAWITSFTTGSAPIGSCPGYADPNSCPPFPTGGSYAIDGVVTEHRSDGDVPVANPRVYAWVQTEKAGYSRGATTGDSQGRFRIDNVPSAQVILTALGTLDQPCAGVVNVGGANTGVSIELISPDNPMPERATVPPVLTGVVYEIVDGVRRPVPGVRMYFDAAMDLIVASTTTDANGRYAFCHLPAVWSMQTVWISSPEFQLKEQTVSISGATTEQDIELKR